MAKHATDDELDDDGEEQEWVEWTDEDKRRIDEIAEAFRRIDEQERRKREQQRERGEGEGEE